MVSFSAKIKDPIGLHARPASVLVKSATQFTSDVVIKVRGKSGNLKSIMNVMALGVKKDEEVVIEATGADEAAAIKKIKEEMQSNNLI